MSRAYAYTGFGGPETETFIDRDLPGPGPGQLLVAVRAAGVNPVDHKRRSGLRVPGDPEPRFPVVLGSEVAGTVVGTGPGTEGFASGDAVFGPPLTGGYAEHTLMAAADTAHKPDGLPFTAAATLQVAAATAYDGLQQLTPGPGTMLVVTGAGGGVGVAAVQLAVAAGARVLGVASAGKKHFVESLGAVHVPPGPWLAGRLRAAAGPGGVHAVYDLVGGAALEGAAETLGGDRSRLISAADRELVARLGGGPVVRARTVAVLDEVARLAVDGTFDPHLTEVVPFGSAGRALRTVEEGHARGKTVIEVAA